MQSHTLIVVGTLISSVPAHFHLSNSSNGEVSPWYGVGQYSGATENNDKHFHNLQTMDTVDMSKLTTQYRAVELDDRPSSLVDHFPFKTLKIWLSHSENSAEMFC